MPVDPARLTIIHHPEPVLHRRAQAVESVDDEVRAVAQRMLELMHAAPGVGLAAPQVGLPWRLFVANPTGEPGDDAVFVNPELVDPTPETESGEEGCLSLPDVRGPVTRPVGVTLKAVDEQGDPIERRAEGFEARVWQHEFDHLDGVLIVDRMTPADRRAVRRAMRALDPGYAA
ncbi:MAG: peptide deformylase [Planctomycetota bacterium]